jgi:hypothetical protein
LLVLAPTSTTASPANDSFPSPDKDRRLEDLFPLWRKK